MLPETGIRFEETQLAEFELSYASAADLARRIAARTISPVEVVENSLSRIQEIDPTLNCFCFTYPEEALEQARSAERAVMSGRQLGPLYGIPIAIKDLTPTRGKTTTQGSHVHEHWVPNHDSAVVARLAAAGAIMVGKTTTAEFAALGFTESPLWGVTRNPWNPAHASGGSSGGSAVAVATGCVPMAEGSDMGGSVRIPAAFCGIVGLKPSFGRIPFDLLPSQFDTYCHHGPLVRSVGDAALFLGAAQGPDNADILTLPSPLEIPESLSNDVRGMRVALSIDLGYYAVDREVEANTRAAASALSDAGAMVEEVEIGWTREINDIGYQHWNVYLAAWLSPHLEAWREAMHPSVVKMIEAGLKVNAVDFKRLEFARTEQWQKLRPVLERYDALICPTASIAAPPIGVDDYDFGFDDEEGRFHQYEMTFPFNIMAPCPALSVPSGFTRSGLPTGLQIVGRRYDDLTVLRLGAALERLLPDAMARPPI